MNEPRVSNEEGRAKEFFERYARDFDHIYEDTGKGALARFIDTRLRYELRGRFEKCFAALEPLCGRSLLDAGCGSGRYAIPAAKAGASEVLGVDFSEPMLEIARRTAEAEGVSDVCRFVAGDLLKTPLPEKGFDYAIAIGLLDYFADPEPIVLALARAARRKVFVSLPKRWHVLTPQRKIRYTLFKCFVRFYSRAEVERLANSVSAKRWEILDNRREFNLRIDLE